MELVVFLEARLSLSLKLVTRLLFSIVLFVLYDDDALCMYVAGRRFLRKAAAYGYWTMSPQGKPVVFYIVQCRSIAHTVQVFARRLFAVPQPVWQSMW